MKRKLLSILLCLAMALSLLPTAALAEGEAAEGAAGGKETNGRLSMLCLHATVTVKGVPLNRKLYVF